MLSSSKPLVADSGDPLGVTGFATHHLPLEEAPHGYDIFQDKADGCIKGRPAALGSRPPGVGLISQPTA